MRRFIVVAALGLVAASLSLSAPALAGGGGCGVHPGLPLIDEYGVKVEMRNNCFSPEVLRVATGDTVTFVNRDGAVHAVAGVGGTFGDPNKVIPKDAEVSFRFDNEGVLPFFCTFHPGMVGAVVVGDGVGDAVANPTAEQVGSKVAIAPVPGDEDGGDGSPTRTLAVGGLFLGVAFLGAVSLLRRRRAGGAAV